MADGHWNPWKATAIGMALVIVTALVTGLVVANWKDSEPPKSVLAPSPTARVARPSAPAPARVAAAPSAGDVQACNDHAKGQAGDKILDVVKDTAVGGAIGAGVGAATGAIADGGKGAGKGAGVGGVVGLAAGALYGLNATKAHDARYVEAYRACMRSRGHTG